MSILRKDDGEGPAVLVCAPCHLERVPGSTRAVCTRCVQAVWVAPSGRAMLAARPDMRIQCMGCAELGKAGTQVMPPTVEQLRELEAYFRSGRGGH